MREIMTASTPADIAGLTALDDPHRCHKSGCGPGAAMAAHATLADLARWWLLPAQRQAWQCDTLIVGNQGDDKGASNALFRIQLQGWDAFTVFYVLSQHWGEMSREKKLPHYQLQLPDKNAVRAAGKRGGRSSEVEALIRELNSRAEHFKVRGMQSVSLHQQLPPSQLATIQSALANFVVSLRLALSDVER